MSESAGPTVRDALNHFLALLGHDGGTVTEVWGNADNMAIEVTWVPDPSAPNTAHIKTHYLTDPLATSIPPGMREQAQVVWETIRAAAGFPVARMVSDDPGPAWDPDEEERISLDGEANREEAWPDGSQG